MQKLKKNRFTYFKISRYYINDIKNIINIIKENYNDSEIIANDYKIVDISEILDNNIVNINSFEIKAYNPYISVEIKENLISVYISDIDDINLLGIESKICSILKKGEKKLLNILSSNIFGIPFGLITGFLLSRFLISNNKVFFIIGLFMALIYVAWSIWAYNIRIKRRGIIYLNDISSMPNFFKRNKDAIILSSSGAILGGIITYIITLLTSKK